MRKLLLYVLLAAVFFSCRKTNTDPGYLPNSYSDQALGASAHDLLSADKYTTLNIQVQYMPGYALDNITITNVTAYLNALCNKPGGINISQAQIAANGATLDPEKVAILEKQNRTAYTSGQVIALYVLVTDGDDTSLSTLGFAYRNTSVCLFGKTVFEHSGGFGEPSRVSLESSVLEHELGHILGLVNTGTPMVAPHEDTAHARHCSNSQCLMYYSIDVNNAGNIIHPNYIPALDSSCLKDLHANGGK